ncbi:MAG: 3'(2'),5'-bisphosphate nucleotidase CysQ [Bacteroidaceae bacterium]|nr:3'(2'),5'-bisphosphate nucleotidase CysQ [Bacteroidaceae bacterium]
MFNLLNLAVAAALEAGAEIMRIYLDPKQDFGIEKKADNSPLTLADKAAHNCIVRHLAPTNIPILSEEGAHLPYEERRKWHRLWVVDPLDGTKEFIKKNGEFTVNIALVEDGSPILGVIYVPATEVLYTAIVGEGAWKAPFPLPPLGSDSKSECREENIMALPKRGSGEGAFTVVASRSHMNPETEEFVENLRKIHDNVELISSGSSLKICLVAEGTADVYPRFAPTMEWDTAAGDAIARAAGRKVTDAQTGQPLTYNKPDLHNPWFIVS